MRSSGWPAQTAVARIRWQPDPRITKLVDTWPGTLDASRARALGFPHDDDFDAIVRAYVESRTAAVSVCQTTEG